MTPDFSDEERDDPAGRDRLSRLSQASLRINESLDFDTVLQEVVDGARVLTASRYGVLTTMDGSGYPQNFVTSGMTADELGAMENLLPEGLLVYQYLSALERPLRVGDYASHMMSLGLPDAHPTPIGPFVAVPIRHGSEGVGNIYLGREEGGPGFSSEDEETLVMFAPRRPWSSPTQGGTGRSGGPGRAWRPWWRPRPWGWWSSTLPTAGWPR